ncbi:tail length tape measure protein [Sedimentitalea sp. CY04]|uniref:Tail length tape measure protein n=1 Tax=Parasedimentitalea denitrificans TaxID=2211118 RepID=A0ABX0W6X4_9RHOB|nr:lytic transglycosylase domain-containing protein [Sedimentitalea sp. CY04]NIZ61023.1 tail length tape measure protein [Sedimentitalea sp. CY04]
MTRILALLTLISALWVNPAAAQQGRNLGEALDLMRSEKWSQASAKAAKSGDVAADVIEWHRLREGMGSADDVLAFLERRPDWPGLAYLRRKSETAVAAAGTGSVLEFYVSKPPQTAEGVLSYARALIATGKRGDAEANLVEAWRTMPMGSGLQTSYLKDFSRLLKPHHAARLDRLLWDDHLVSSKRMLPLVSKGDRKLAEARIALQERSPGVDAKIEAIPAKLRNSPGLAHDRFQWRDRKKRREDAIKLMLERSASASGLGEPEQWARRRRDLARQDMRDGNHQRAYQLAARHFTTPEAGYNYSDLEWLAGYIALRKLNDPTSAVQHFMRFIDSIETPISIGRGGYWLGRAYAAMGEPDKAHEAYALGANYQTSFYGLLAAEQIGRPFDPALENPPEVPSWEKAEFAKSSMTKAALMMIDAGELDLAERFLTHLVESLDEVQARQLGLMAVEMGQSHLAVMISKRAARQSMELHGAYFPMHPVAKKRLPMAKEMMLAISRRESEFDHKVISGAGARGLMQVMPATAKLVATELGILAKHATSRLTVEWDYNAKLGANYLAGLAGDFNGNVVMMSAGYNAGPRRPIAWMERYGDPRDGTPDIVDWIEHIPFNETRNYVMRVTESLPVYRARLGKNPLPVPFSQELAGSTLHSFAP